jgi:mannose-6-phosphate isomerase-like protein (cupin superfamily)
MGTAAAGEHGDSTAWWFLDALVIEHRGAPRMTGTVLEMLLPVGHSPVTHIHDHLDDSWYVLDGSLAVRCGDDEFSATAGRWLSLPRGVAHTFRVVGNRPARILLVHDNGSFRDFVRDLASPALEQTMPPTPEFPSFDVLGRVAAAHDLRPVGPPMTSEQAAAIVDASNHNMQGAK